jgi:hypothetical protein
MDENYNENENENDILNNIKKCITRAQNNIQYFNKICENLYNGLLNESYIFSNITDKQIIINNKVNHITLSNCNNCVFSIRGCLSGIDLLKCKNVKIIIVSTCFSNIEICSNILLNILNPDFTCLMRCNDNIYINNKNMHSTPFNDFLFVNLENSFHNVNNRDIINEQYNLFI